MEELELPRFVQAERDGLLAEVHEAFAEVSRVGGVSWSEAVVIDRYGSPEECAAAREKDWDARWQDVLDDPSWNPESGIGGWSFLDAIGFRYYLPAAMVVALRQGWDSGILYQLTLPEGDPWDWVHDKWSLFDVPQRLCIKRFMEYMAIIELYRTAGCGGRDWIDALYAFWGKIPNGEWPQKPASIALDPPSRQEQP